ncbi:unnamed protein product [Cyberlindnera jadinii]|uniref:Uncharacterized protein n=1 Tax=Cyberlindnera jadinii (strain ATCC 18201 / CBS 1600 / BCRC 20928 / JCM 3617 / NBRC 0987 / NRRL Y-1542) TaxID=983966 RepID=A0A0H5C925_CYBJN|nr:unnamed protein product [Cyberlindnera jadinii]
MTKQSCKSISYVIGDAAHTGSHVLPVNSIRSNGSDMLFTAGRDGALVVLDSDSNLCNHIQLHSDWCNDVVWHSGSTLVSCSSDLSVKWWDFDTNEHGLVGHHEDYVKAMCRVSSGHIVTGGLDKVVNTWDLETRSKLSSIDNTEGEMGSIYSMSSFERMVTFGDNKATISLFDTRSNEIVGRLDGHGDIVKSLVMGSNGQLLSGSSDGTVRLWDLKRLEEVKQYTFDGSIWSLYSDDVNLNKFYTGTSQGTLYETNQDLTKPLGQESSGLLSICKFQDELWSSNMGDSTMKNWNDAAKTKRGAPGLIKSRLLNNRRHVVTLSTDNEVVLWDIVKCRQLQKFGTDRAFEDVINQYQTQEILPTWCQVMIRAGQLFVVIKESNYTNTELYGDDIREYVSSRVNDDTRYTLGKMVLTSIFHRFVEYEMNKDQEIRELRMREIKGNSKLSLLTKFSSHDNTPQSSSLPTPVEESKQSYFDAVADQHHQQSLQADDHAEDAHQLEESGNKRRLKLFSRKKSTISSVSTADDERGMQEDIPEGSLPGSNETSRKPSEYDANSLGTLIVEARQFYQNATTLNSLSTSQWQPPPVEEVPLIDGLPENLHIIVNECINNSSSEVAIYSDELRNLQMTTLENVLPRWLGTYLLKNRCIVKDYSKVGFTIQPDSTSTGLPALAQGVGRLNAYSMLRVKRILAYITDRFEKPTTEMNQGLQAESWLQVLCHGKVLDNRMTLATVRSVIWKQSGDVVLTFRRRQKETKAIL